MCRSVARIFHMFLCHIEQGLRTRERNISGTGVFKALVPWSICLPKTVFRKMKTCYCYHLCPACSVGKTKVGSSDGNRLDFHNRSSVQSK